MLSNRPVKVWHYNDDFDCGGYRFLLDCAAPVCRDHIWAAKCQGMSTILNIHPQNPQQRMIDQAVAALRRGALIVYPTDSSYAFGWMMGSKQAMQQVRRIRGIEDVHHFSLVCRDLSELATYAKVDNTAYRLLRAHTPGPFTFILNATRDVPRRLQAPKRRGIGLRVPDHPVVKALLDTLGEPILSTTVILADEALPLSEEDELENRLDRLVDVIIFSGAGGLKLTSVVDLTGDMPHVVRQDLGDCSAFLM